MFLLNGKQKKKFISYHLLKGKLKIELLNKKRSKIFKLDEKNKKHLRIKCDLFRKVISLKPMTIFLEICEGPFKNKDTIQFIQKSYGKDQIGYP